MKALCWNGKYDVRVESVPDPEILNPRDEIDPSFVITHQLKLDDAAKGYAMFKHKDDGCIKVVLKP